MKYLNLLLFAFLLAFTACGEKENLDMATVTKNCFGTFIQVENTYYQVCNEDILTTVESGTKINLNVKHLNECEQHETKDCSLIDPIFTSKGWVDVIYTY